MPQLLDRPETHEPQLRLGDRPVMLVRNLPEYEWGNDRALELMQGLGQVAIGEPMAAQATVNETRSRYPTLKDAIQEAAAGNTEAFEVVWQNAFTDSVERIYKAGHDLSTPIEVAEDGRLLQYGQYMRDVYRNALKYGAKGEAMRRRTYAETRNGFRLEALHRSGWLENVSMLADDMDDTFAEKTGFNFVVISMYPDDMSDTAAKKAGFFEDTKSCAIQAVIKDHGGIRQESAFVAGVREPGLERHDKQAVVKMLQEFGIDASDLSVTEMIDLPLLIPKELMPHGVIDLVERYDKAAGGTFFGQNRPVQDYLEYRQICRERERKLMPSVQRIVRTLLSEAKQLVTPLAAFKRLHEVSQAEMLDYAFVDQTIDPRVFGATAAHHIEAGRLLLEQGKNEQFIQAWQAAHKTAKSFSCPVDLDEMEEAANAEGRSGRVSENRFMRCPFCGDDNQYGDPCSSNQFCTKCKAWVKDGALISRGYSKQPTPALPVLRLFSGEKKGKQSAPQKGLLQAA